MQASGSTAGLHARYLLDMRSSLHVPRSERPHRRPAGLPAPEAASDLQDPSVLADLRRARLPANPTRVRILMHMRALDRPVTPNALYQQLDGRLSRVSVYRALAELARADLVNSFRLPGGKIVYSAGQTQPALRLACPRCGQSAAAPEATLGQAMMQTMSGLGYSDQEVLILALCNSCTEL